MLKTLGKQVKEFRKDSILTPVFMILEVIMETIIPLMMSSIVDDGVDRGDLRHIYLMGGCMIVAAGFSLFSGIMGGFYGAKASTGLARNLREAMFETIQRYSFSNIDKFSTAGLVTRLTTDVTNVQNAYQMILRMFVRAPFTLIFAMSAAFLVNVRIACIYLLAVIVLGIALALIMTRCNRYFSQVFKKYDDLNASVQENVSSMRVVKAYVREEYEKKRFMGASRNVYRMFVNAEKIMILNMPLMQFTIYGCILLISWIGGHMIVSDTLSTGELMLLLTYCMNILTSLMMVSMVFVMVSMSAASARRIAEILEEEPEIVNPREPDYEVLDGSVEFRNVSFRYAKRDTTAEDGSFGRPVLQNINLNIRSGETIGILGATGSAKTSLVNLISRLYDVSEGQVLVGGKDVRTYDLETLRNQVAVVLQKNVLFSGTILDNLRWGDAEASEEECRRACELACADEFIQKMPDGYHTYIEQGGTNVSGGQKQRLTIARALLKKPKILILDDSTSAVDTATDAKIRRAFAQEIPDTTKFIIAQRISSISSADRILVMEEGQIHGFGTHEELMEHDDIYRDVYESQMNGSGDFDEGGDAEWQSRE